MFHDLWVKLGVGNVRPAGRIRPAEWKWPAPKPFLNVNGIRPARHFKNLYEIRKVNVIITKFEQNLFWIVLTKLKDFDPENFFKNGYLFLCWKKHHFVMVCCFGLSLLKQSLIKLPQKHLYAEITYLMIQSTIFTFINNGRIKNCCLT